ncbi:MAG: AAC(3) family N-acetyltransferase [Dehalococcoidia bacterium]|nr:AAC(3) family N-acetyltransferase [Dehalococcoidia bacterium]
MGVATRDISAAVQALGLLGRPLCVHASLRSFGWVEGGAPTIIAGLLEAGCTPLVPTFSWDAYAVAPLPYQRLAQNGTSPGYYETARPELSSATRVYAPEAPDVDRAEMGAIPAAVLSMPGRVRGNHPLCSFAAVGPVADELVASQRPMQVFDPLRALAEMGGSVVLMGVGLTKLTLLHLAEQLAGRNLFRRWAPGSEGQPMAIEVGGCSRGFGKFEPILAPIGQSTIVGRSRWQVYPAQETLDRAAQAIRNDPMMTHCGRADCDRCNDAVLGGPILPSSVPMIE